MGELSSSIWDKLKELTPGLGIRRPNLYHDLGEEMRELWDIDATDRDNPEAVLAKVTAELEGLIAQLKDGQCRVEQCRAVARVTFNVGIADIASMKVMKRRKWLYNQKEWPHPSVSESQRCLRYDILPTFERILRGTVVPPSRDELLRVVEALPVANEPIEPSEYAPADNVQNDTTAVARNRLSLWVVGNRITSRDQGWRAAERLYVKRRALHSEFAKVVRAGTKLIILVGLPGIGKTWLARGLTKGASRIRVASGKVHLPDLAEALSSCRIDPFDLNENNAALYLARVVCGKRHPKFLILDNLDSSDELANLLPARTLSMIVAACRHHGDFTGNDCRIISVGSMSDDEATEMVNRLLSNLAPTEATLLVPQLHGYPLAVRRAVDFVVSAGITIKDFGRLRNDFYSTLGATTTEDGSSLASVFGRSVEYVAQHDPLAYELLVALSFLSLDVHSAAKNWVPESVALSYLRSGTVECDAFSYGRAVRVLREFGLAEPNGLNLIVHPLVSIVLRNLFDTQLESVAHASVRVLGMRVEEIRHQTLSLPTEAEGWEFAELASHALRILTEYDGRRYDTEPDYDYGLSDHAVADIAIFTHNRPYLKLPQGFSYSDFFLEEALVRHHQATEDTMWKCLLDNRDLLKLEQCLQGRLPSMRHECIYAQDPEMDGRELLVGY